MIDRLIQGLAAGSDLTAEEILDVLWLCTIRPAPATLPVEAAADRAAARGSPAGHHADERSKPVPVADGPALAPDVSGASGVSGVSPGDEVPLWLSAGDFSGAGDATATMPGTESVAAGRAGGAIEVGFGAPRLIRDPGRTPRALRRLRQVRRPGPVRTVDIDATVEATAAAGGVLVPVFTHLPERSLDLALVVDDAPEMRIWDDTFDEFARLMAQTGAFRSVERWRLVVNGEVSLADASGKVQPTRRLIDPSGRRVVFVATNASGEAWYAPGPWETIASWSAAMPTALIQVLPQHYWAATAIGEPYVTIRAERQAAPNAEYASRLAWWAEDPGGIPLPVVALAPEAMETWAQAAVSGTAWVHGITATAPDPEYSPAGTAQADANALVNDFLARASAGAQRLARILATSSGLSMPLIAVLQESLAPDTGVLELAEILSSGLLSRDGPVRQPQFRFREGTRQILGRGMTTFEEWDAYAAVSRYLESRHRLGGPLRALMPAAEGTAALDPADEPFAALHEALANRLGLRAPADGPRVAEAPEVPDVAARSPSVDLGPPEPRPTAGPHRLYVHTVRATHQLEAGGEYRIGRDDRADIPLSDPRVSWDHAVLFTDGWQWILEDRGSGNGTWLRGERISRLTIEGMCVIHLGNPEDGPVLRLEFELAGGMAPDAAVPGVDHEPTSRIPLGAARLVKIGRRPDNDIVLADLGVSKAHAELRLSPNGQYQIVDLGSHNGTYVNGHRVNQAELTEDDIVSIGHATFRLADGVLTEYMDDGSRLFEAWDLRLAVADGGKQKVLLDGISFALAERTMMAVIGPAGAGKSVLLNALTGKRPRPTGSVRYDDVDLYENIAELERRIGVVPQQPSFSGTGSPGPLGLMRRAGSAVRPLTPRTALEQAAKLRFTRDTSVLERKFRVDEVLAEWSLTPYAGTRIDLLSADQRKRVDIGLALLTKPRLLFLDDPTSALDPHLKRALFMELRTLTEGGTAVVVFTHDVDHRLLAVCDRLLVLAPGGKMAYFGPPAEALRYFGEEDWADVFELFANDPGLDFAGRYRMSPDYLRYVSGPMG